MEDLMADLDLLDPPFKNEEYTWSNKRTGPRHIVARLDRFLYNSSFLQRDMTPSSLVLSSTTSDHKPIFLSLTLSEKLGPIPFHFNPLWLQDSKALEIIQEAWNTKILGSASYIWESKLRASHLALKNWAKISFKGPTFQKNKSKMISLLSRVEWRMKK